MDNKEFENNVESVSSWYINLYPRTVCSILDVFKNEEYITIESLLPCLKDSLLFLESIQKRGYLTIEDVISFIQRIEVRSLNKEDG